MVTIGLGGSTRNKFTRTQEYGRQGGFRWLFILSHATTTTCALTPGFSTSSTVTAAATDTSRPSSNRRPTARPSEWAAWGAMPGFSTTLTLDTGETYTAARLGKDTEAFNERLSCDQARCSKLWEAGHATLQRDLAARLGETHMRRFREIERHGAAMKCGLFAADAIGDDARGTESSDFWFAGIRGNRAVVELVIGEAAASYLYEFPPGTPVEQSLRQAMEAVGAYREIIFLEEDGIDERALYHMFVDRSRHVRCLRAANVGRVVHNARWEEEISAFLA